jgi:hypothetical protein
LRSFSETLETLCGIKDAEMNAALVRIADLRTTIQTNGWDRFLRIPDVTPIVSKTLKKAQVRACHDRKIILSFRESKSQRNRIYFRIYLNDLIYA